MFPDLVSSVPPAPPFTFPFFFTCNLLYSFSFISDFDTGADGKRAILFNEPCLIRYFHIAPTDDPGTSIAFRPTLDCSVEILARVADRRSYSFSDK
jgi:hypothetical protein